MKTVCPDRRMTERPPGEAAQSGPGEEGVRLYCCSWISGEAISPLRTLRTQRSRRKQRLRSHQIGSLPVGWEAAYSDPSQTVSAFFAFSAVGGSALQKSMDEPVFRFGGRGGLRDWLRATWRFEPTMRAPHSGRAIQARPLVTRYQRSCSVGQLPCWISLAMTNRWI